MRVLLTGATGYIGTVVAEKLRSAGHTVVGVARSNEAAEALRTRGDIVVRGDINAPQGFVDAMREADAVIHTASDGGPGRAAADTAVVETVLDLYDGSGKRFVYTGSLWDYGSHGDEVINEDTPFAPLPHLAWRPLNVARVALAAQRGMETVVIHPAMVYGRGGGPVTFVTDPARAGRTVRVVGDGSNRWPLVHVDDMADLYVRALEGAPSGASFIGVHGAALPLRAIAAQAAAHYGVTVEEWPLEEARAALGPFADGLALDQQASSARAVQVLGWAPHGPTLQDELAQSSR